MDNEQKYDYLEEMMATTGWRILIDEAKQEIYDLQALGLEAPSWDKLLEMRGQAKQLNYFVHLGEVISNLRQELSHADL